MQAARWCGPERRRLTSSSALRAFGINTFNWTIVLDGAALELQGDTTPNGISVPEHFHFNGVGPAGKGGVRSVSGDNSLTNAFALDGNSSIGVDAGSLTTTALIYHDAQPTHFALTRIGDGTLNLNGLVQIDTLNPNAGTTNLNNLLLIIDGTPGSTLNANATTCITVSQTLEAVNISDGTIVTLGPSPSCAVLGMDAFGAESLVPQGGGPAAVPEPGSIAPTARRRAPLCLATAQNRLKFRR